MAMGAVVEADAGAAVGAGAATSGRSEIYPIVAPTAISLPSAANGPAK